MPVRAATRNRIKIAKKSRNSLVGLGLDYSVSDVATFFQSQGDYSSFKFPLLLLFSLCVIVLARGCGAPMPTTLTITPRCDSDRRGSNSAIHGYGHKESHLVGGRRCD
jgi:hypothetical protein